MAQDVHVKLNPGLPWQQENLTRRRLFCQQLGLNFKEEVSKSAKLRAQLFVVLKLLKTDQKYLESSEI